MTDLLKGTNHQVQSVLVFLSVMHLTQTASVARGHLTQTQCYDSQLSCNLKIRIHTQTHTLYTHSHAWLHTLTTTIFFAQQSNSKNLSHRLLRMLSLELKLLHFLIATCCSFFFPLRFASAFASWATRILISSGSLFNITACAPEGGVDEALLVPTSPRASSGLKETHHVIYLPHVDAL